MTNNEKMLREHSRMKLFNFYLDDITKLNVLKKLRECGLETKKGTLSALIRVLLAEFVDCDDAQELTDIIEKVNKEYIFTTKKNKRSTM